MCKDSRSRRGLVLVARLAGGARQCSCTIAETDEQEFLRDFRIRDAAKYQLIVGIESAIDEHFSAPAGLEDASSHRDDVGGSALDDSAVISWTNRHYGVYGTMGEAGMSLKSGVTYGWEFAAGEVTT
jgi:hypothetical protein